MVFYNYTCKPILRLKMYAGGGVAPESRAAAKNVPVDCTKTEFKHQRLRKLLQNLAFDRLES